MSLLLEGFHICNYNSALTAVLMLQYEIPERNRLS